MLQYGYQKLLTKLSYYVQSQAWCSGCSTSWSVSSDPSCCTWCSSSSTCVRSSSEREWTLGADPSLLLSLPGQPQQPRDLGIWPQRAAGAVPGIRWRPGVDSSLLSSVLRLGYICLQTASRPSFYRPSVRPVLLISGISKWET